MKHTYLMLLAILIGWTTTPHVQAQSAKEVLRKAADRYEQAMDDIDDMTMVLLPKGDFSAFDQMTTYYKKTVEDGQTMFKTHTKFEGGFSEMAGPSTSSRPLDLFSMGTRMYEELSETAEYKGKETLDGATVHVLFIEDMTPLMEDITDQPEQMQDAVKFSKAQLYIDASEYVVRKMEMVMGMHETGVAQSMKMEVLMSDYRQVGPLYYPFSMKTIMENPISDEQRAELESQRAQIESTLAQLPEAQRHQMRKMLNALGNEQIVIEMIMKDLQVNKGVPAELF